MVIIEMVVESNSTSIYLDSHFVFFPGLLLYDIGKKTLGPATKLRD